MINVLRQVNAPRNLPSVDPLAFSDAQSVNVFLLGVEERMVFFIVRQI